MGSVKESPRYNVVSLRISDEEREVLEDFARQTRRNVSQLMREAMELLMHKMDGCESHDGPGAMECGAVCRCEGELDALTLG